MKSITQVISKEHVVQPGLSPGDFANICKSHELQSQKILEDFKDWILYSSNATNSDSISKHITWRIMLIDALTSPTQQVTCRYSHPPVTSKCVPTVLYKYTRVRTWQREMLWQCLKIGLSRLLLRVYQHSWSCSLSIHSTRQTAYKVHRVSLSTLRTK